MVMMGPTVGLPADVMTSQTAKQPKLDVHLKVGELI